MSKILLTSLYVLWGLVVVAPLGVCAAEPYDDGYVRVLVPDMSQAETFFQDVLDCRRMTPEAMLAAATPKSLLLSCDEDLVVELVAIRGELPTPASSKAATPLRLISDDVPHASAWLRLRGVAVRGGPHRLVSGPRAGHLAQDFVAPWGLRLQLLDRNASNPDETTLANAEAPPGGH